jgi:hypothetical protein
VVDGEFGVNDSFLVVVAQANVDLGGEAFDFVSEIDLRLS